MDNGGRGQEAEQEGEDEDGQTGAEEDDEDAATDEEEDVLICSETEGGGGDTTIGHDRAQEAPMAKKERVGRLKKAAASNLKQKRLAKKAAKAKKAAEA